MDTSFGFSASAETHECESIRDGEWIVFRCPICLDYERRINPSTGRMTSKNVRPDIHHTGSHIPSQLKSVLQNVN